MKTYLEAVCWAGAMALVAAAEATGLIDQSLASTLFVAIPAVMFATMSSHSCRLLGRRA